METNNIQNLGIDLVDKRRLDLKNFFFIKRILTKNEYNYFLNLNSDYLKLNYLSSRWTAKEAIFKSLNNANLLFFNIEVLNDENGKPYCNSHKNIILSTTHSKFYTLTIAINLK